MTKMTFTHIVFVDHTGEKIAAMYFIVLSNSNSFFVSEKPHCVKNSFAFHSSS